MAVLERDGLLERERELAALDALLDAAGSGSGGVAVIEGPAGIGKTRLLAAACNTATAGSLLVLRARGSDLEREFGFGVVRRLLESVVARDVAERGSLFTGVAAHAASVFAAPAPALEQTRASPSRAALEHALFWLVANLAERGPLMVAVDDAHWADEASLSALHYVARRVDELPVALLLAARQTTSGPSGQLITRIAAEPETTVLALGALSAAASGELVRALVSADVGERVSEACYAATGGNPLLLRELAGALQRTGVPGSPAEPARVERLVPEAVTRHVLVRLARQPPSAAALARAVAVLGQGAETRLAAALASLDATAAAQAIDGLVAADILAPQRPPEFVHPLLREVIYAEQAPGERALAHARAARLLADAGADPEQTAAQLLACQPAGADWAIEILRAAARNAQARGASHSAATYLARALAEPPSREHMPAVLTELGLAEAGAALPHAPDHLAHALRLTGDPIRRASIAPELAVVLEHQGRPAEAVAVLEDAIDALPEASPELRLGLEAQAVVTFNTFLAARRALQPRTAGARARLPDLAAPEAGPLLAALAHDLSHRDGTAEQAAACAERALADGRPMSSLWGAVVLIMAAEALARCGRLSRAEAVLDALVASARARGATEIESNALTARARTRNERGRPLEAEADARLALESAEHAPVDFLRPYKLAELATALIERGETAAAARLLTPSELARHDADQTIFQPRLQDRYARLLMLQRRYPDALDQLRTLERADRDWDIRNPGWTAWRLTARSFTNASGIPSARPSSSPRSCAPPAPSAPRASSGSLCARRAARRRNAHRTAARGRRGARALRGTARARPRPRRARRHAAPRRPPQRRPRAAENRPRDRR